MAKVAPKPASRPKGAGIITRIGLFRRDMFSSQPHRLYRAWMAQVRLPFFRSFLVNDQELVRRVLVTEAEEFPKSEVLADTLVIAEHFHLEFYGTSWHIPTLCLCSHSQT